MFRLRAAVLITLILAVVPGTALSQSIGTDRPDFVESSSTVGKGSVQVEGSVAFDETEISGTEVGNWTTPILFRVGIADAWELRLESDSFIRSTLEEGEGSPELTTNGVSDFAVGVKWAFFAPERGERACHGRPGSRRPAHGIGRFPRQRSAALAPVGGGVGAGGRLGNRSHAWGSLRSR